MTSARRAHARADRHRVRIARQGRAWPPTWSRCSARPTSATPAWSSAAARRCCWPMSDAVQAQGNIQPDDGDRVHGCGASDMKGALAVMIELALAGHVRLPVLRPRGASRQVQRARAAAGARAARLRAGGDRAPTSCTRAASATSTPRGRSTAARATRPPVDADNADPARHADGFARRRRARGARLRRPDLLRGRLGDRDPRRDRANVIPDRVDCHVNYRFAPGRTPAEAGARLRELCPGGKLTIDSLRILGPVATYNPRARALIAAGDLTVAPKQAWTPVAGFAQAGLDAVDFRPGSCEQARARDEFVEIAALERSACSRRSPDEALPVLAVVRTYPFRAPRRGAAAAAERRRRRDQLQPGEQRGRAGVHPRGTRAAGWSPQSRYPAAGRTAGPAPRRSRRGAGHRFGVPLEADTEVVPTFGSRRRSSSSRRCSPATPGDRAPAVVPGLRARRRVRGQGGRGAAAAGGRRVPARPRRRCPGRWRRTAIPLAETPRRPDQGEAPLSGATRARRSHACTTSCSPPTRPIGALLRLRAAGLRPAGRPPRANVAVFDTLYTNAPRCLATAPASSPAGARAQRRPQALPPQRRRRRSSSSLPPWPRWGDEAHVEAVRGLYRAKRDVMLPALEASALRHVGGDATFSCGSRGRLRASRSVSNAA